MPAPRLHLVHAQEPPDDGATVFQRSWPTQADLRNEILAEVANQLTASGWVSGSDHAWLRLCLDEALTNAMYHGNEGDPRLRVGVTVAIDDRCWTVLMDDQGEGFDHTRIPTHDTQADLQREHGRGIRLMQEWLDELDYWRGGRVARLRRHRADRPTQVADFPT